MFDLAAIFDCHADFDAGGDFESFLRQIPPRWVVYLFADQYDQPLQLLCVKNLRASLKRRLGAAQMLEPTRRINYREVVRRVYWRRVDSAFEADWIYLDAARQIFPQNYRNMIGFRPAWFVHVDAKADFPRYIKTTELAKPSGTYIGPLDDKRSAVCLIELLEDAFDLCRYYNILLQAPRGKACPYKEMGKCPAPCDGSIAMLQYQEMIASSLQALIDPAGLIEAWTQRMKQAAAELQFESAGRIKANIDRLAQLGKGPFRHARPLADFAFLSIQHGPRSGTAKVFLVTPHTIEEFAGLIAEPADDLRQPALAAASQPHAGCIDEIRAERIGLVSHHLFSPRQLPGSFLPLTCLDPKNVSKAYRDLQKHELESAPEADAEGIVKELHATE